MTSVGEIFVSPDWPAPAHVRTAVTTRNIAGASRDAFASFNLGANCGDDEATVQANRAALVDLLKLPAPPRWLRQVHGTDVAQFDSREFDSSPQSFGQLASHAGQVKEVRADSSIARTSGIVLAVLTADCLPLLICADDGSEIAAIHAGWRGIAAGVIEHCVETLRAPCERLLVWLGPTIGPRSFEVGDEVRAVFVAHDIKAETAFVASAHAGHWFCDLYTLVRLRLAALGVSRIFGGTFDTFADTRFYSYRREKVTGRFASLIWIE